MKSSNSLFLIVCSLMFFGCNTDDSASTDGNLTNPTVQISNLSDITNNGVTLSATVTNDGGSQITTRGFCWSTDPNPDLNDNTISVGNGTGMFEVMVNSLLSNTEYFVRAFATNSNGTSYSSERSFVTTDECSDTISATIVLRTQQEVENFGANNYCAINGPLEIRDVTSLPGDPITDLSPLSGLQSVTSLLINNTVALANLDGLENLNDVSYRIHILDNEELRNINSIVNVSSNCNSISIIGNDKLENIDGLLGISTLDGTIAPFPGINIAFNPLLQNVGGLQNFESIVNGEGKLLIQSNPLINNIDGLSSLPLNNLITLVISDNENLTSLSGISHLTNYPGFLFLQRNNNSDFTDLSNLTSVGGDFEIQSIGNPDGLSGLENLTEVGGLFKIRVSGFTNVDALSNLHTTGSLWFDNTAITNLDGLSQLQNVEGDFRINNNSNLVDFCGITPLIMTNGILGGYIVEQNGYNPTIQDIINGDCSL